VIKRPKGLGRGLDALLGVDSAAAQAAADSLPRTLPLNRLQPGKYQPRTRMNAESLAELADSIRAQGVMQPILVRPLSALDVTGAETYEIIAGERRFRASLLAGLTEVPVLVRAVPDEAALAMALIENIQREDLNPLEEAQGVQRLIREFDFTHEQAAQAIGRSRSATSNLLRLLNLAAPVQQQLMDGVLDMGHARALLAVDAATQIQLGAQIGARRLSVREVEALVARSLQPPVSASIKPSRSRSRDLVRLEEELSDALATPVSIHDRDGRGRVVIDYASLEQLQGILDLIRGRS
jgi:ParB family chromosome partitioning protein